MPRYETVYDIDSKTYAAIFHTAWHLLDSAETNNEGSLLNLQAATVFFAFSFEAYLNHVGSEEIKFWNEIERISYTDKLSVLSKHLGFPVNKSHRPFHTIKGLFSLRNALAHGRTQRLRVSVSRKSKPAVSEAWLQLPWEKLTTKDVRRYHDDVEKAVEEINSSRIKPDPLVWNEGERGYSRRVMSDGS